MGEAPQPVPSSPSLLFRSGADQPSPAVDPQVDRGALARGHGGRVAVDLRQQSAGAQLIGPRKRGARVVAVELHPGRARALRDQRIEPRGIAPRAHLQLSLAHRHFEFADQQRAVGGEDGVFGDRPAPRRAVLLAAGDGFIGDRPGDRSASDA